MPNHVINIVKFTGINREQASILKGYIGSAESLVDFSILLPVPLNCWMHDVSAKHQQTFPDNALDWCAKNWSTKWNAYGEPSVTFEDGELTLKFQTAWRSPYGWLCALFNKSALPFEYRSLSEGESLGRIGKFDPAQTWDIWTERTATPEENDALGKALWGEDSWAEINAREEVENPHA